MPKISVVKSFRLEYKSRGRRENLRKIKGLPDRQRSGQSFRVSPARRVHCTLRVAR